MDIIDKIFNKLEKDKAPHSLRAKVLDIPSAKVAKSAKLSKAFSFSRHGVFSNLFKAAVPALIIVLLATGFFYTQYWRVPQANASFGLVAEQTTENGIETSSSFILTSSANLSTYQVKQIVKFSPEVEFSVEKAGDKRYKITPKGALTENQIYKVSIAHGPADHDYSWAYQVKADFQVISTLPGNRGTQVPVATGIEINLNRENLVSPEKFFDISPSVTGSFEQHGTVLLFRPSKPLGSATVYKVSLKQGLTTKSGEVLAKDYVFSFETDQAGSSNMISFPEDFYDIVQSKPVFPVYASDNAKAKGVVYKFAKPEEFIASYAESDNWQYSWSYYNNSRNPKDLDKKSVQKVLEYDISFTNSGNNQYIEIPQDMENGYYLFEVTSGSDHNYVWFQKTPLAHYASYSYDRSLVWVYDFDKKQPLKNVSVQLPNGTDLGSTDDEGLAQFDTPKVFQDNNKLFENGYYATNPNVAVIKSSGYNPYYIVQTSNYYSGIKEGSRYWEYLSTDRPLYQLTDSIQFWGIVRPRDEIKTPSKVTISLYKGEVYNIFGRSLQTDEPVVTKEVPVSDFSTYEGKIDFTGLSANTYTLVASQDGYVISSKSVSVTTFSKPAYVLNVTTDKKAYNTDEVVTYHATAKFYDETPVPNLSLRYSASNGNTGTIVTNSKGEAEVDLYLPYTPDTAEQPKYWPEYLSVDISAEKAEEGFIRANASVNIVGPKLSLEAENKPQKDGTNSFAVTARTASTSLFETSDSSRYNAQQYNQAPVIVGQDIKASIKKTTYTPRQTGEYYDFIDKVNRPIFTYDKAEAIVETVSGVTDKNGVWKFDKKYNYEENVYYSLYFEGADKEGKVARTNSSYIFTENPYFYTDNAYNPNGLQPQLNSNNASNYNEVNVGDQVQFNLQFNNPSRAVDNKPVKILYYAYQRNILKATTSDSLSFVDIFAQGMSPMVGYKAVVLGPIGFEESNPIDVYLDTKNVELKIETTTDKENYRPGEEVNATIKVTDTKGNAGKGTVYVSVVDEAVFDALGYDDPAYTLPNLYKYIIERPSISLTQYSTPNGDGGGGGGGPGSPRSKFLDTVFSKSVELGRNGEAKISFQLPENLTSWRITSQAFDPNAIRAGSNTKNISTGLPLFADLSLSSVYVKGDSPEFRVRVFGKEYDETKPVKVSVSAPGLSIDFNQEIKDNTAYIPAKSMPVGTYPISVSVSQGNLKDNLTRTITVLDSNLAVPKTASYKLEDGLKNISGNENGLTEVVVIDAGIGKQFNLVSGLASQGGIRFDQRASSYFAQTVLHDIFGLPNAPEKFDPSIYQSKFIENTGQAKPGLSLFSYADPELRISALGAALIPDNLPKDNLVKYFNGSLRDTKADNHRISQALFGLAAYNQPVLTKLQLIKDDPSLDFEDTLFVTNALALLGDKETARKLYIDNIKPKLVSDSGQMYISDPDETRQGKLTALTGVLASQLNEVQERDAIALYLQNHLPKKDIISLEQGLMAKFAISQSSKDSASFKFKTNQRSKTVELKNGERFNLSLLTDEFKSLDFSKVKGDLELVSWYRGPANSDTKPGLDVNIKRSYYSVDGQSSTTFKDGDLIQVVVDAEPKTKLAGDGVFQITDILPSGLRPVTPSYYSGVRDNGPYIDVCNPAFTYPDIIDGNKISFTVSKMYTPDYCPKADSMKVIYFARVVNSGSFRADPAILTSLDNPSLFSIGQTQEIKISH